MTETKIFVSHHHSDKKLLSEVKGMMRPYGVSLFLAHEDIDEGALDTSVIMEEINLCDFFFIFGSQAARSSIACNQEIGMALAYKKPHILCLQGGAPWGFLPRNQAIVFKSAGDLFFDMLQAVAKRLPDTNVLKQKHEILCGAGLKHFIIAEKPVGGQGVVTLVPNRGWNDWGYKTQFYVYLNAAEMGSVKTFRKGQEEYVHTANYMPTKIPFVSPDFISRSHLPGGEECDKHALSQLLNDINVAPHLGVPFKDEWVLRRSLFRDDPDEFQEWKKLVEKN